MRDSDLVGAPKYALDIWWKIEKNPLELRSETSLTINHYMRINEKLKVKLFLYIERQLLF